MCTSKTPTVPCPLQSSGAAPRPALINVSLHFWKTGAAFEQSMKQYCKQLSYSPLWPGHSQEQCEFRDENPSPRASRSRDAQRCLPAAAGRGDGAGWRVRVQNEPGKRQGLKRASPRLTGIAGFKLEPVNTPGWMHPPEKQKKIQ